MPNRTVLCQIQSKPQLIRPTLILILLLAILLPTGSVLGQTPVPTVTSISPAEGLNTTITNVQITGSGFFGQPTVRVGNTEIQDVTVVNTTILLGVVQAGLIAGTYDVSVENPDGQQGILVNGFTVLSPNPDPRMLMPDRGRSDVPNDIYLYGFNFSPGVQVQLVDGSSQTTPLLTNRTISTFIRATVPAGLSAGVYDVRVINPGDASATLIDAYTVFDVVNDDLYANDYELWSEPVAIRAGGSGNGIGLIVHRQGGKQPVSVIVRFYNGDPDNGGALTGEGSIALLSPRSWESTSKVAWNPPTPGNYEIFAVIDPDELVNEALETNNKVSRTITVLPPAADLVPPRVDQFVIDKNASTTTDDVVLLDAIASDPIPGSGVARLFYQEFEFSQGAGEWIPVKNSGWLSYSTSNTDFAYTLMPNAGVKYLQAWAADAAGNISVFPYKGFVSYVLPTDRVGSDQVRVYRYQLNLGDRLTARLEPVSGDPDLYVWTSDSNAPPYVSNLAGAAVDEVSFTASGAECCLYQLEVYGYSASEYRLSVTITPPIQNRQHLSFSALGGQDSGKPEITSPAVPLSSEPRSQTAVSAPSVDDPNTPSTRNIYLPTVTR